MTTLDDVFNDTNQVYRLTVQDLIYQSQKFGNCMVRLVISSSRNEKPLAVIVALTGDTKDLHQFIYLLDQYDSQTYDEPESNNE